MSKSVAVLYGMLALVMTSVAPPAAAQGNYPSATIRIVVGFAPGGSTDVVARLLAPKLSAQMNANVIVDNKPGADSALAASFVAKSRPDGYALFVAVNSQVLGPALGQNLDYDLFRDFAPVALLANSPQLLLVHPSVPANTPAEFVAHLKANPDKLAFSSAGAGSSPHLTTLLFLQANGLTGIHVPYKGSSPAVLDLVGGRIQFAMQSIPSMLQMVRDKRVRALAVTSLKRSSLLPEVPTLAETIMPGFETGSWNGILVPANTPPDVVKRLNAEILRALQDPEVTARLIQLGIDPLGSTPEAFGTYLAREVERWTKVVKSAGIKAD